MNYTAKNIYDSANKFKVASDALSEKLSLTNDVETYIAPFIVNAAFSIELYLKCLYMIENNKPSRYTHNFFDIYKHLSNDSKGFIEAVFNMLLEQDSLFKELQKRIPSTDTEFESILREAGNAFARWRYSYEGKLTSFPSSNSIITALILRIKMLEPKW